MTLTAATHKEVERLGMDQCPLGVLAMVLAGAIDDCTNDGILPGLTRELRSTLQAMAEPEDDTDAALQELLAELKE